MGRAVFGLVVMLAAACTSSSLPVATESSTAVPQSVAGDELGASASTSAPATAAPTTTTISTTTSIAPTTTSIPTIEECLAEIPIAVRVGQLLIPVITQSELAPAADLAGVGGIAGVVLVGAIDASIVDDISDLQARSIVGPSIVAVDEEGGRVQRVANLVGRLPSARAMASEPAADARERARAHAVLLAELGFTMNLAPVLDLDTGTYIRDRSFSADPDVVTEHGLAVAAGIADGGLTPVTKHFPGHGRGVDSHTGLPQLPPLEELRTADLIPFEAAAEQGLPIMVGHLVVPDLTGSEPASLSAAAITGLLRGEFGFDGLVLTDALNMDAISATRTGAEAAEAALAAGADLAMVGRLADVVPTVERVVDAVETGLLEERSINRSFLRVLDAKGLGVCDLPADVAPAIRCDGVSTGGCALVVG